MPIHLSIPGRGESVWRYLVLDLNGTLSADGIVIPGVAERIQALGNTLEIHLLTADTRGTAQEIAHQLAIRCHRIGRHEQSAQKARFISSLGAESVVAIGNGANDSEMLALADLGIAVLGPEGTAVSALLRADIVVPDICTALDLLLNPQRVVATLRV